MSSLMSLGALLQPYVSQFAKFSSFHLMYALQCQCQLGMGDNQLMF